MDTLFALPPENEPPLAALRRRFAEAQKAVTALDVTFEELSLTSEYRELERARAALIQAENEEMRRHL